MLLLSLIWLIIGLLIGGLACGARLRPVSWGRRGWPVMLGVGMVSALLGGWLGAWVFGVQYATVTALWVGVVGVFLPWLLVRKTNDTRPRPVGTGGG
jgi:hypothetical protein